MLSRKILQSAFAYQPSIKFLGPRSQLAQLVHDHNSSTYIHHDVAHKSHGHKAPSSVTSHFSTTGKSSIFIHDLIFPQLTEEQIDMINMGGALDAPLPKLKKSLDKGADKGAPKKK